ncbi:Uncharacterised protein [Mycobacterium tuberculosis]|uniref:Uncharacterized protein n=1 Tax=Mycobacterium tuberculosis TaxID=1773 RepID=A0A0U0RC37_MYCTX|nr:Uncharacterised protein [Mycobacterium tuberculosis]
MSLSVSNTPLTSNAKAVRVQASVVRSACSPRSLAAVE